MFQKRMGNDKDTRWFNYMVDVFTPPTLDQLAEWINENLEPDDVFDDIHLAAWAEEKGYIKKDEE